MPIPVGTKIRVSTDSPQSKFAGEYVVAPDPAPNTVFSTEKMFGEGAVNVVAPDRTRLIFTKDEYEVIKNG